MLITTVLIASRFVHYFGLMALFGAAVFQVIAFRPPHGGGPEGVDGLSVGLGRFLAGAGLASLVSACVWLAAAAAQVSDGPADAMNAHALFRLLTETSFGNVWALRLSLSLVLALALLARPRAPGRDLRGLALMGLAAVLLVSLAWTGHTQLREGAERWIHRTSDALHLLGASLWLGGLMSLGYILWPRDRSRAHDAAEMVATLSRFSALGYLAVALLVVSGVVNAEFLVGGVDHLVGTNYGRVLAAKLVLFTCMLTLAGANRFWIVPRLKSAGCGSAGCEATWMRRIRRHVLLEQVFGLGVLACVSVLGTLTPAASS